MTPYEKLTDHIHIWIQKDTEMVGPVQKHQTNTSIKLSNYTALIKCDQDPASVLAISCPQMFSKRCFSLCDLSLPLDRETFPLVRP